ncbi:MULTISPECIES: helix-turn-helix transcriptional regulator [unclassified Acidisoma]|jgi:transcriptional regulator with XRE-family HTH domain|uniref:helix-turn-helix domain-containing protein n=1 Tax=unclassified Acidisoma TaxID=2634065 RepID=UPI00131D77EC|nr:MULTISPECIES: helix-turn-helix transcriptional regulator [unclassified Acidisoma]
MLNMRRKDLAVAASVGHSTLFDFETGKRNPHPRTLAAIRSALEGAGAEFIERESGEVGVTLRPEVE